MLRRLRAETTRLTMLENLLYCLCFFLVPFGLAAFLVLPFLAVGEVKGFAGAAGDDIRGI